MRRALATLLIAAGLLLGWSAAAVDAATVADAGWWDRDANDLVPQLDPPPDGALRVANDPTGARAIAAVRFGLEEGEQDPALVLRVAGDPVPDGAAFVACPATSEWSGAEGAPLSEAPTFDCEAGAALGLVAADATSVSFDLSQLNQGATVDVVINPSPTGESPIADTFTVDFDAPVPTDITTAGATAAVPSVPSGSFAGGSAPAPAIGGSPGGAPVAPPSPSTGGFTGPAAPSVTVPAPGAPPATPPTPGPASTPASGTEQAVAPPIEVAASSGTRWIGVLTAVLIVGLGAHLWRSDRARSAMTAGPVLGGLGPFVRERSAPAPDVA